MKRTHVFILAILLLASYYGSAQERIGLTTSNYAGINGTMLNPTSIVRSNVKWDLNFIAAGIHFDNNFLYFPKSSLTSLTSTQEDIIVGNVETLTGEGNTDGLILTARTDARDKIIYQDLHVRGPSFMICFDKWAIGFHSAVRAGLSMRNIPITAATLGYEGLSYEPLHDIGLSATDIRINHMSWTEFGLTLGAVVAESEYAFLKAAVTPKYLQGMTALYFLPDFLEYEAYPDSTRSGKYILDLQEVNARYGYSGISDAGTPVGNGMGFDVGVTYVLKDSEGANDRDYIFRLGASVIDIGSINFASNAAAYQITQGAGAFGFRDSIDFDLFDDDPLFDNYLSNKFFGDTTAVTTFVGNAFDMALPMAASIQADIKMTEFIYLNALVVQRIPKKGPGLDRANLFAVTPRFESRWLEFHMPFELWEYQYLRVGVAARLAYLTVGSDKFGSLFMPGKFSGTDFYFSLKFFVDKAAIEERKSGKSSKKPAGFTIPCFNWW